MASKILSWRHTGFNVHSKVRAAIRNQAERVARYMAKPILALKRLSFDLDQGKVIYRYGDGDTTGRGPLIAYPVRSTRKITGLRPSVQHVIAVPGCLSHG